MQNKQIMSSILTAHGQWKQKMSLTLQQTDENMGSKQLRGGKILNHHSYL